jgi:hypothetical protein
MKILLRVASSPAMIGLLIVCSLIASPGATGATSILPRSPLSGGVLMGRAIRSGAVKFAAQDITPISIVPRRLLGNVQASEGGAPVDDDPIVANPNNPSDLLTAGNDYNCRTLQGFYTSSNGGKTWLHSCMTAIQGLTGCGDPGVGYDLHNVAYIAGVDNCSSPDGIAFETSTDNGQTWSAPAVAVNPTFTGGFVDNDWVQVDDNASSPYANTVYISATQFNQSQQEDQISVSHSSDGGATWSTILVDTAQTFPTVDQFSNLAISKNGTVYVAWLRCTANSTTQECASTPATLELSSSTDGGNTWSTPVPIATVMLAPDIGLDNAPCGNFYGTLPNTCVRVSDIPAIAIDNSSGPFAGHLYAAMYNWTGSYMQVEVATSTDGGNTWSTPVPVAPSSDTHDQFFPWVSVSAKGTLAITWLDRRNDPSNISYETFAAGSTNGGTSFTTNIQMATAASNPFNDGFGGSFLGDFRSNVWDGSTLAAAWPDTRNGTNSQDEAGGYACSTC